MSIFQDINEGRVPSVNRNSMVPQAATGGRGYVPPATPQLRNTPVAGAYGQQLAAQLGAMQGGGMQHINQWNASGRPPVWMSSPLGRQLMSNPSVRSQLRGMGYRLMTV